MNLSVKERLKQRAKTLIHNFMNEIEPLKPKCVILFGSYAKGNFTERSDIDVCVIAEKLPENELDRRILKGVSRPPGIKAIGFLPDEFIEFLEERRTISYTILAEGEVIKGDRFLRKARKIYQECVNKFGLKKIKDGWIMRK